MIAILSFSSLAWFSDSDTDDDGVADTTISEGEDAEGEEYDAILPGDVLADLGSLVLPETAEEPPAEEDTPEPSAEEEASELPTTLPSGEETP